jgi:hypothetical protein
MAESIEPGFYEGVKALNVSRSCPKYHYNVETSNLLSHETHPDISRLEIFQRSAGFIIVYKQANIYPGPHVPRHRRPHGAAP